MKSIAKKQAWDYELIAMSFHEAGHAVVGLYSNLYVFNVNVMTPKNKDGNTVFNIYRDGPNVRDEELKKILLISELQTTYAGLIAEKIYYKDICGSSKFPMHLRIGSSYDIYAASALIRKNNLAKAGKNTYLFKKEIQYDVEQILLEHWDAVKVIAHALYRKKRLSFDELKNLLTRKIEHKDFWKDKFKKIKAVHNENNYPTENTVKDLLMEDAIFSI